MALWELQEFQGPQFLGFVRNIPVPEAFAATRWLPDKTVNDLDFEYILGSNQRPVMAHVMGWDSEAPIHGRPGLGERIQGSLPPIKRKARFSEQEIIRFLTPRAGTSDVQQAIDSVYDLTATLIQSVFARAEWLRIKALSEDKVVYNEGGVIFSFDFGLNDTFQIDLVTQTDGAGTSVAATYGPVWSDTANANWVADLQAICDTVEDATGFRPVEIVISRKTLGYMLNNVAARIMIRGSGAPATVLTQPEVDALLALYGLPSITTYDVILASEKADGTYEDVRPMDQSKAFLMPPSTVEFGNTLWGPTAESRPLIGTNLQAQAPGVYATTYGRDEPPEEWVKAVGVAFPSMPGANALAQMTLWDNT